MHLNASMSAVDFSEEMCDIRISTVKYLHYANMNAQLISQKIARSYHLLSGKLQMKAK